MLGLRFRLPATNVELPMYMYGSRVLEPEAGREEGTVAVRDTDSTEQGSVSKVLFSSSKVSCSRFAFVAYMGN